MRVLATAKSFGETDGGVQQRRVARVRLGAVGQDVEQPEQRPSLPPAPPQPIRGPGLFQIEVGKKPVRVLEELYHRQRLAHAVVEQLVVAHDCSEMNEERWIEVHAVNEYTTAGISEQLLFLRT